MPRFSYKGRSSRGEPIEGIIEAASTDAVANQLFKTGVTPIDIGEIGEQDDAVSSLAAYFLSGKPTLDDLIMFSRQMYTLQRTGVPIIKGIAGIAQTTRSKSLRDILYDVSDNIAAGRDMASSLARHPEVFSNLYVSIIRIGESSGSLDDAFLRIYEYLMREKDTRDQIKNATRYPSIVLSAVIIAIAIANFFIIPVFARLYENIDTELPFLTSLLIAVSDFTADYWFVVLITVTVFVVGFINYIKTEAGRYQWHAFQLRIPVIGKILMQAALARYCRSFSISLRSGVPLVHALTIVSNAVGNDHLGARMLMMRNGVEQGESLASTAAAISIFPPLVLQMLAVGEESGTVEEMLDEVADFYDREVDYDLKYLSDALQPILIVTMGGLVLVLALGLFLPMWDMYGHMTSR